MNPDTISNESRDLLLKAADATDSLVQALIRYGREREARAESVFWRDAGDAAFRLGAILAAVDDDTHRALPMATEAAKSFRAWEEALRTEAILFRWAMDNAGKLRQEAAHVRRLLNGDDIPGEVVG